MPTRFVLDASIFRKYSVVEPNKDLSKHCSIDRVYEKLDNGKKDLNTAREILCLLELLKIIANEKAKICMSNKINNEYIELLDEIPKDVYEYLCAIMSNEMCIDYLEGGLFKVNDFNEIKNTDLEKKGIYLDIATALPNRIIVSTKEDKDFIYTTTPNNKILFKHRIHCRYTWEHWKQIRHN
jgi:hypothetical protein